MARAEYPKILVEDEPTAPHGGRMRWVLDVEPFAGLCVMLDEEAVREGEVYEADRMMYDLETAEWLAKQFTDAVAYVKRVRTAGMCEPPKGACADADNTRAEEDPVLTCSKGPTP